MVSRPEKTETTSRGGTPFFWPLQVGSWTLFAAAMSIGRIGEWPFAAIVAADWSFALLGFVATLGLGAVYSRTDVTQKSLRWFVGVALAGSYVGSLFWTAAYHLYSNSVATAIASAVHGELIPMGREGPMMDNTVYNAIFLLAWSVLYFGLRYYEALQQERERALRAETQAHQAKLQMLAYQLNPHFLFNTLNSLRALIDEDRDRARRMVTELAGFLRYTLLDRPLQVARFSEELEVIRAYLEIELIRFEEQLEAKFQIDPAAEQCTVPAFLLHPLVENALKHGFPSAPGTPLRLHLRALVGGDRLRIGVDNTGSLASMSTEAVPPPESGPEWIGAGIGLRNVRARLQHLFPGDHRLEVREEDGWVRVLVDVPATPAAGGTVAGQTEPHATDPRSTEWQPATQ